MTVLDVVVPISSVLVGAGITYHLNVRQRRRNRLSDLFDEAVETVSVVVSSMGYVPGYGKWHREVSEDERVALEKEVAREATKNHMRAIAEARDAVAKCSAYAPDWQPTSTSLSCISSSTPRRSSWRFEKRSGCCAGKAGERSGIARLQHPSERAMPCCQRNPNAQPSRLWRRPNPTLVAIEFSSNVHTSYRRVSTKEQAAKAGS